MKEELEQVLTKTNKYINKQLKSIPKRLRNFYLLALANDLLTLIENDSWYIIDRQEKQCIIIAETRLLTGLVMACLLVTGSGRSFYLYEV